MVKLTYIGQYDCYVPGLGANEDKEVTEAEAPAYLASGLWVVADAPATSKPAPKKSLTNGEEPLTGDNHQPNNPQS